MKTYQYGDSALLFPREIEDDPWIIYHGTSSLNEQAIDRDGFVWTSEGTSRDDVRRVVEIFETMRWDGMDSSSMAILKPFSLQHDFNGAETSPIYFAETSKRALLYATHDFAGGEKLRSIRQSYEQLKKYLTDPQVRQQHMEYLQYEYDDLENKGAHMPAYPKPGEVDLEWLSNQLSDLEQTFSAAVAAYNQHQYGVVYAVKVNHQDTEQLKYHKTMGIKSFCCIKPSKIIAKAIIPSYFFLKTHGRSFEEVMKLEGLTTGVYATIKNEVR